MTTPTVQATPSLQSRSQLLGAVGRRVRDAHMSTGARASLRRGTRHDVARQAAFFAVLTDIPEDRLSAQSLARWAVVVQCMAITGVPESTSMRDGSALAQAGLAESRFARLLASHGDGLFDQLLLVARYVHSKDVSVGWKELGELALTDEHLEERAEEIRLSLARSYYRTLAGISAA